MSSRVTRQVFPAAALYCARALNNTGNNERHQPRPIKPAGCAYHVANREIGQIVRKDEQKPKIGMIRDVAQAISAFVFNRTGSCIAQAQEEAAVQIKKWDSLSLAYTEADGKNNMQNQTARRVMIVLGANGQLGTLVVLDKAEDPSVHAIVGTYRKSIDIKHEKFLPIQIENSKDPEAYENLYNAVIQQFGLAENDSVTIVNTIGAPSPKNGESLHDINVKTAAASASAAKKVFDAHKIHHNINLASTTMADEKTICEYGKTKLEAEKTVMRIYDNKNVRIVRVGFPLDIPNSKSSASNPEHMFKTEQLANFVIPCIAGDGSCVVQPVSLRNVVSVLGKSMEGEARIVNAVGAEKLTLHQLHEMLVQLMDKKMPKKLIRIPIEALEIMAECVPAGHLQTYAVEYMSCGGEEYSHKEFEEELREIGKTLETAKDLYTPKNGEKLYFSKLPVLQYLMKVMIATYKDPTVAKKVLRAISIIIEENLEEVKTA